MQMPIRATLVCVGFGLCLSGGVRDLHAQDHASGDPTHVLVTCSDSPTPGRRTPGTDCAVLAHKRFTSLPSGILVIRLETFPNRPAAREAETPSSAVVEAADRVWLISLAAKGSRSPNA